MDTQHTNPWQYTHVISMDWSELSEDDLDIARTAIRKMLRNTVVGEHKKQIDTVKQWGQASNDEGRARELLEKMIADTGAPVEPYGGGHRENIRLTSVDEAKAFLRDELGGDPPFWM